ncbi:hypothetical protein [Dietzia psychralcaliphila]|uniref:Ig-like domain-containing protein n=1 Tax=Dietzia psychralcaliphila TaxID=139021 RepID=A0AAD0JTL5_9ACTN|nr:hypothetical protein [Dietzia psychralcaliphila]AWH95191.1 hypothetical protein A6048_06510 [Dietzia psychralcaliphila]PTM87430.1 hypothetical protein C8N39_105262 [Dietzia psychralcaliphila]
MASKRKTSALLAVGLVAGIVSPIAPLAVAQQLTTQSTAVTHTCELVKPWGLLGAKNQGTIVSPETVVVRYPATVAPGEVFTAYVQPGAAAMRTTDGRQAGLLSYDIAFPSNSTNLAANYNGGGSGYSIPGNGPALVDRVAANGQLATEGPFARISGGATAFHGANSRNGDAVDRWKAGMQVASNTTFRFPEVALKMRAPVSLANGSTITTALKAAGQSGDSDDPTRNTIQGAEEGGWGTERTNYYFCGSSANAGSLSTTTVNSSLPRYLAKTTTRMVTSDTLLPLAARTTNLTAEVSSTEELMSNIRPGGMNFTIRHKATGQLLATVPNVTVGANGQATASYTFPTLSNGSYRDEYEVTATYAGRVDDIESSTSEPVTVSVGYNEVNANVVLTSTNGALSGGTMPVTLRAAFALPAGKPAPAGLAIQLFRNDLPHGAPITIPTGTTTANYTFPTDTLTQAQETRTYRYRAEVVPVISGVDRFVGGSATPVAAIVVGSSPGSPLPEGGQGSVALEGFFRAPQLVWDWLTGSIGQAGAFSSGFAEN